jgi:hypothetical protein
LWQEELLTPREVAAQQAVVSAIVADAYGVVGFIRTCVLFRTCGGLLVDELCFKHASHAW